MNLKVKNFQTELPERSKKEAHLKKHATNYQEVEAFSNSTIIFHTTLLSDNHSMIIILLNYVRTWHVKVC